MSPRDAFDTAIVTNSESYQSLAFLPQQEKSVKSVGFGNVEIRYHNRTLGDHPDVKVGPPVSLSWEIFDEEVLTLDEYTQRQPEVKPAMRLTSITRKNLLRNVYGFSEEEIRKSEKEIQMIQKKREQSANQSTAGSAVQNVVQSARRKLRKTLLRESLLKGFTMAAGSISPYALTTPSA